MSEDAHERAVLDAERALQAAQLAVTFVVLRVRGTIEQADVSGRMRYTRTWTRDGGTWRVLAAHIAPAA